MLLTDSEVRSPKAALHCWEWFGYISTAIVFLGCTGEFLAEFTSLPKSKNAKNKLARLSLIVLILGIAGELLGTVRTSQLSGQLIANIEERAGNAEQRGGQANERAANLTKLAEDERVARVQIEEGLAGRQFTPKDTKTLIDRLTKFRGEQPVKPVNGNSAENSTLRPREQDNFFRMIGQSNHKKLFQSASVCIQFLSSLAQGYAPGDVRWNSWCKPLFAEITPTNLEYGIAKGRGVIAMQKHPAQLRGTPSVAFVNPAHLKKVWNFWRDFGGAAVSRTVFGLECGPVDDGVSYRASMLWALLFDPDDPLAPWRRGLGLDDVVFRVAAVFPIEWVGEGISQGLPFDVDAFLQQLRDRGGWVQ